MPFLGALLHPDSDGEFGSLLNISIAFKILSKLFLKKMSSAGSSANQSARLINMHRMEDCHSPLLILPFRTQPRKQM